jgi:hypothetical protein
VSTDTRTTFDAAVATPQLRQVIDQLQSGCVGAAIYVPEPRSPLQNQVPANRGAEVAPRLVLEIASRLCSVGLAPMASYKPVGAAPNNNDGKTRTSYRARRSADAATYLAGSCLAGSCAAAVAAASYENSPAHCDYGGYYDSAYKRHRTRGTYKRRWNQFHCRIPPMH